MKNGRNIILGIILIAVGLIIGTNALGLTSVNIFFDGWWTLFIIVPCAVGLFTNRDKAGSIIGLLIGVSLLLACRDVFEFEIMRKLAVPVIVILIGVSLIFRGHSFYVKLYIIYYFTIQRLQGTKPMFTASSRFDNSTRFFSAGSEEQSGR